MPPRSSLTIGALAFSVVAAAAIATSPIPARAAEGHVLVHEFYGRGGSANQPFTHKFVELFNPTSTPVSLDGMSLQYRAATATGNASGVAALTGTVNPGGYFLVQLASNGTVGQALPTPDAVSTLNPSGTTGTVALVKGTTAVNFGSGATLDAAVVDLLGYGTSNTFEGAVAPYNGSNSTPGSLERRGGVDTDNNAADFGFTAAPTPRNSGAESTPTPTVSATPTSTPTVSASPTLTPTPTGTPTSMPELTPIAAIQGPGDISPLVGKKVTTRGIVTAAYPDGGLGGSFIQTPGTGDTPKKVGDPSDGLFAYKMTDVNLGACVDVTGTVAEFKGSTQIIVERHTPVSGCEELGLADLNPFPAPELRESYESMMVRPMGSYTVTENYKTNQFGSIGLAVGTSPLWQGTEKRLPGAPADALEAENKRREIILDDGATVDYLRNKEAQNTPLPYITATSSPRVGSWATFRLPVILDYRFDAWTLQPQRRVTGTTNSPVTFSDTHEVAPEPVGGDISVATFNVLNYFTDLGKDEVNCRPYVDREGKPVTTNMCNARGAYTTEAFQNQQAKIATAITLLGADVVGLEEIENSAKFGHDRDQSLKLLVEALDAKAGKKVWDYVRSPKKLPADEDVIRTAFIYKRGQVSPVGQSVIHIDAAFDRARYPLAQKFRSNKADFVVVTNHFKSKGSPPASATDPNHESQSKGQGNWNALRVAQAQSLLGFTKKFGTTPMFLLGDFNAYSMEDPMRAFTDAGWTDLVPTMSPEEATYQFAGRIGSLDHVLANQQALAMTTGARVWDINADESIALEYSRHNYNVSQLLTLDQYRSSDHDPIKVGLTTKRHPTVQDCACWDMECQMRNVMDKLRRGRHPV